jgi:iron complex outermembrane receptor protein
MRIRVSDCRHRPLCRGIAAITALSAAALASPDALAITADGFRDELKQLSLEELMNVEVSTASRIPERQFESASAVHILTRDEIRRAGVRSIPEALRLVPGVEVARESSSSWNITMRGFNGELSNKLLVLIDGRSVYTPLFAGVFWDVQDTFIGDIDRIEVVGGPGGSLWGANAVNGVINIITRSAKDTHGGLIGVGGGDEERLFGGLRFGGELGNDWHGRGYLKFFERDGSQPIAGGSGIDDWEMFQGGFRFDREAGTDSYTVQGDAYQGEQRSRFARDFTLGTLPTGSFVGDIELKGGNVLGRWSRQSTPDTGHSLQFYFDRTEREIPGTFAEDRDTVDIDFHHYFPVGERHDLHWGAGLRYTSDSIGNTIFATFIPASRSDWTISAFLQDKIDLWQERVHLTVGSKVEHNDYTGVEVQPGVSLTALVSEKQMFWGSISRAVRIPSRLDSDLQFTIPLAIPGIPIPIYARVNGSENFDSEEVVAYEAGWRAELSPTVALDIAIYHNEYEDLLTQEPLTPILVTDPLPYILLPNILTNGKDASADGATLAATWQPSDRWRLQFHYSYVDLDVKPHPDTLDPTTRNVEGSSPEHEFALHTYIDLPYDLSFYGGLRYVDDLPALGVADYVAMDANLVWRVSETVELALSGRNLLDPEHSEFSGGNEIERSWYARISWRY